MSLMGSGSYDPKNFKLAFRRIDARGKEIDNFAIVYASSSGVKEGQFEQYDQERITTIGWGIHGGVVKKMGRWHLILPVASANRYSLRRHCTGPLF